MRFPYVEEHVTAADLPYAGFLANIEPPNTIGLVPNSDQNRVLNLQTCYAIFVFSYFESSTFLIEPPLELECEYLQAWCAHFFFRI